MTDVLDFVRPDIRELAPYSPIAPLEVLSAELGIPVDRLVKLDANENLYGPIAAVREAVAQANLHIYPDPEQKALRERLARYTGLTPNHIVMGAGSDELIDVLVRMVSSQSIVDCPPTFGMYNVLAAIDGRTVERVPRGPAPDFAPDLDGIEAAVERGARLVFLASPNNPTGQLLQEAALARLLKLPALIVIDEAYAEFAEHSFAPVVAEHANLVVLRTFSKWAGLAGLRVGYTLGDPALVERIAAVKQPYNINVAGEAAAIAALDNRGELLEQVRGIVAERERLARELGRFPWLAPLPSDANFVLVRVDGRDAAELAQALRRRGVLVRYFASNGLEGYIRVSAARPSDTDGLLAALHDIDRERG